MPAPTADASGKLNNVELLTYILESGMHPIFARAVIADLDRNGDGSVDEAEWKNSPLSKNSVNMEVGQERLKALFETLDKDGSGYLDYNDFKNMEAKGQIEGVQTSNLIKIINGQLEKMDRNQDGKVSLDEFLAASK